MNKIIADKIILDEFNPPAIAAGIAERMRQIRIEQKLTQSALASRSGVSLGSIKRFENRFEISLKHLLQIALALDSLDGFHQLFPVNSYGSIDELLTLNSRKARQRFRSRKNAGSN